MTDAPDPYDDPITHVVPVSIGPTELARLRQNSERWEMALKQPWNLLNRQGPNMFWATSAMATENVDAAIAAEKSS